MNIKAIQLVQTLLVFLLVGAFVSVRHIARQNQVEISVSTIQRKRKKRRKRSNRLCRK